jgi:hypothetical protein
MRQPNYRRPFAEENESSGGGSNVVWGGFATALPYWTHRSKGALDVLITTSIFDSSDEVFAWRQGKASRWGGTKTKCSAQRLLLQKILYGIE